jgi:predicted transcriptional regulator YdeE
MKIAVCFTLFTVLFNAININAQTIINEKNDKKQNGMNNKTVELSDFKIIGVSVRTTNQGGKSQKDIGELWGKFMGQNIFEQIPNKESNNLYCIYTDYETDFNGPYTTILGCKVKSLDSIPKGLVGKIIPATKYNLYTSTGKLPDCVMDTWKYIWQSGVKRKYIADFDVYGEKAQNHQNAEVDTYLSIY